MQGALDILYRGPLKSCNYACEYCPFAKSADTDEELARDRAALDRFVDWIAAKTETSFRVLVTPWGEGLVRHHYREALVRLSHMEHVRRAVIQTNLSCSIEFARRARPDRLALWATYHPDFSPFDVFVRKVKELTALGVAMSVGMVGFPRLAPVIEAMRAALPPDVYLWINAVKDGSIPEYDASMLARLEAVDPNFTVNVVDHPSEGAACRAGSSAFTVDGAGDVRRCHFVDEVIGNLYDGTFATCLRERPCPNAICGCYIGYMFLERLGLDSVYGEGLLERVPARRLPVLSARAEISHS